MLDNQQYSTSGGLEDSQALLLQAIWSLEEASGAHDKLIKLSRTTTWNLQEIERAAILTRNNIKRSLDSLSDLHLSLFRSRSPANSEIGCYDSRNSLYPRIQQIVTEQDISLMLTGCRSSVNPRLFQLQDLLKYFSENPVSLNMSCTDITLKLEQSEMKEPPREKEPSRVVIVALEEEVTEEGELPTPFGKEPASEGLIHCASAKSIDLSLCLKQLRQYFERQYEVAGIPLSLVDILHSCEIKFSIVRDPTTDSIWNIDHQRLRNLVFDEMNIGIAYRQKCICDTDTELKGAVHALDLHCPRLIPEKEDDLEWDEYEKTWMKKRAPRPASPAKSNSDEDENNEEDAEEEPEKEKTREEKMEKTIASITEMVGLEQVKGHVQKLKAMFETSLRQGVDLKQERFGTVFLGNPGAGKTTFAKQYAQFLCDSGVVGGNLLIETTGIHIATGGVDTVESHMASFESHGGGVLLIDEAHYMMNKSHQCGGKQALDFILGEIERQIGTVVFVLVGPEKEMRKLLGRGTGNAGTLLPYTFKLPDFSDEELLSLLVSYIKKKFDGKMEVEGGFDGVYLRIASRRLGRNRGKTQFGNARAVGNLFAQIWERQSIRRDEECKKNAEEKEAEQKKAKEAAKGNVDSNDHSVIENLNGDREVQDLNAKSETEQSNQETKIEDVTKDKDAKDDSSSDSSTDGAIDTPRSEDKESPTEKEDNTENKTIPEDYMFTKEDILGPVPSDAILDSPAWKKLQSLTGLKAVKESILNILQLSKTNYQRELEEKPLLEISFNRLFLGPPGTGKTVVAKLYGQILAEIGVLSKGELLVRNPTDLIGKYIGQSEANTKSALSAAMGNVLVIDEAYMMYGGEGKSGGSADVFRQAVVDTLVSEVQSVPGEDRCVLLLGYADEMQEMLQNCNPGLSRRFPLADAFWFHDFTMEELESILRTKLEDNSLEASKEAIKVAMDVLDKARSRLNFGNGGEVENVITRAKTNYQSRIAGIPVDQRPESWTLEPQDFDPEFDRGKSATLNLHKLFSDVVGCEAIVSKLEQYQRMSQAMKLKNMDPKDLIPTNFVFKGPPGTGKTTTARKIAQVYYDMGFLAEPFVVECSASDLVGKYIGHSGPKTVKALERGLGKVLFIDEAYRLAHGKEDSSFTSEVVSELVDCLTKPKFFGKIIVILAGYENEMNHLLSINPGLASRFPEEIHFPSMTPTNALKMLKIKMQATGISIPVLSPPKSMDYKNLVRLMGLLAVTPSWGNGRDVETLAKTLCRSVFMNVGKADDELVCTTEMVTGTMEAMLLERRARMVKN